MELLDSRRLRHFLAVYDLRSIGQAAEKLFVTQPALSKSIRMLEQDLKVTLFDRTPLGVVPTVFGELLAQHAKVIRSEMRHAELEISNLRGAVKGHVSIGVGPSAAASLLPAATQRLRQDRPGIHLTVTEGLVDQIVPALRRGELDLAVGSWPRVADSDLTAEVLTHDYVGMVCGPHHPLAARETVELGDLLEFPWALPPQNQRWRQLLEETFLAHGLPAPSPVLISNSAAYLRTALFEGHFLSYLPWQGLPTPIHSTQLVALRCDDLTRRIEVTVTYRERAVLSPAAHAIVAAMREVVGGTSPAQSSAAAMPSRSTSRVKSQA